MTNQEIAKILDQAAKNAKTVPQMAEANKMTLAEAYAIQRQSIAMREQRGEQITGYKMGFTSKAKMEQMGVHDLIWGILTDEMEIQQGETVILSGWIHPKVEPEIAFRVSKDIDKQLILEELPEYLDAMAPALEIIDSRYENFNFSLEDVVADNCSSTGYVIGNWQPLSSNISNLKIDLIINDEVVESASSAAILKNPLQSVVELSRLAIQAGVIVKKGHVILAGAATKAHFLKQKQTLTATVESLGKVIFKTV
ncbi:MAG: 4-oxalocrotonate decarboxylase [Bacteroidetes bacterium HGW-Bacteroidetes-2]|jgi:2-oxo-3-hexenedioate decarboxylase|nr:MAG: 4-oxalocrotonate decarboxylase [Bacteroidetes bacterium HGW-Bacteroidetes-2]